ncbi:MAG TPA: HAMP domain-containing sensor histidine kinase [Candidatus Binatia bacterium]|nr:HAMP domain-containing sensor histidine kinase [Candidatus Binatia bacterium]
MSVFGRYRWRVLAGAVTLAFAAVSAAMPPGHALTAIADIVYLSLNLAVVAAMAVNARSARNSARYFWILMCAGALLWAANQAGWVYCEVIRRVPVPDPWFLDIVLFVHLIPMIAAVGLRPHREHEPSKFGAGTIDFLLLLVWWIFLYAFVVFPSQYVSVDLAVYDRNYGLLYLMESGVFIFVLSVAAHRASSGWRNIYRQLLGAGLLYALDSELVTVALAHNRYYTGSLYDVPLVAAVSWMAAVALEARQHSSESVPTHGPDVWGEVALRLAMLAILSLPVLGLWAYRWDSSPLLSRTFRLFTVLMAMLVMGVFLFMRQYLQDQRLIGLLGESRHSFENEQRLQSHLVQREKLASLGELIAGAAHEIDHPLRAVMENSEQLWSGERLTPEQDALVRKIVNQSQRTRDLIGNLLSFAQQTSGEKAMVDIGTLLQRSVQMRQLQQSEQKIRIETTIAPGLPEIWADGRQLFQAFVQIVENGLDALEETGRSGVLQVRAYQRGEEVVVHFSDNGPGVREPLRVFDPFYTTKPIGKGTGLGLSAVYGVMQDHRGQISCHNRPEGGAEFVVRLPIARPAALHAMAASPS